MNAAKRPQTIQIFLPTGDPNGIRQAEITTRSVRVFDVPRSELKLFTETPESTQPGLYFLLSDENGDGEPEVYIGESDVLRDRLSDQGKKRTWDRALAALSKENSWTKVHVQYMELKAIALAKDAGARQLGNDKRGYTAHVPAPLVADCEEYLETIRVLVSTLGYDFLERPPTRAESDESQEVRIATFGLEAAGVFAASGLTVFAGSRALPVRNSDAHAPIQARQERLIAAGVLVADGDQLVFAQDHNFKSPSGASCVIVGRHSNGWTEWKMLDGRTLDEVVRASSEI